MTDLSTVFMFTGFLLAAYSVVANDSVQTLGTFIASNIQRYGWRKIWAAASAVLVFTLVFGWYTSGGDIAYGRLEKIPLPANIEWYHALAPLGLVILTRYGIPVSTTFLVLSAFASSVVLEQMLIKSFLGYGVAAISAFIIWKVISRFLDEHLKVKDTREKFWTTAQWITTGFLWFTWLSHDMANIAVFLPRQLPFEMLVFSCVVLVAGLGVMFYRKGGKIQEIVLEKTGTRYVRSATIIDFIYAIILLVFREMSSIPMSTTWVFIGILGGRELAIYHQHKRRHMKKVFPMVARDFFKMMIGLAISVAIALLVVQL